MRSTKTLLAAHALGLAAGGFSASLPGRRIYGSSNNEGEPGTSYTIERYGQSNYDESDGLPVVDYSAVEDRIMAHVGGIPDRVSLDPESPHYWPDYRKLGVVIDGVNRPGDVHEFCVSEGWAMVRVRNAKGQFKIDPARSGFLVERVEGRIEPYLRESMPDRRKTVGDAVAINAAEAKRQRKAAKLARQMGTK